MPDTALLLGGTGTLRRTAELLAAHGWQVTVTGRDASVAPEDWARHGIRTVVADRADEQATGALVGSGVGLLVDGQCYTPDRARELARWSRACGSTVMLSAKAVYVDGLGRHLNSPEKPVWDGPVTEERPTMAFAGEEHQSAEGYGANKAEAERVLRAEGERISLLRPSKIHGAGTRQPRLWGVLARVLAGRTRIAVRHGDVVESTTSTEALARTILACAQTPAARVLNVADGDPRPARELLGEAVALAGGAMELIDVDGDGCPEGIGRLPWTLDMELDTSADVALGVEPTVFADGAAAELDWLRSQARREPGGTWRLPERLGAAWPDLAAEDACLALGAAAP
ncbi:reductase [Ornithinimicrobium sp. F0845]|uniref:NAD-dependent epimerase/dehydratase family protein n=1 Tax=Ornithinimicrobium sp. F0845 TaxID=2926412 RepID=UPI001FF4E6CC|nr:reductase [Ornithinimicrobium sp. F0845]MCK0110577.1 reductase [Ornithinimicrobium sp. F0845]